ncbi:hypothetical protein U1Q18_005888 [Sarracenia purpurea var. burkii]
MIASYLQVGLAWFWKEQVSRWAYGWFSCTALRVAWYISIPSTLSRKLPQIAQPAAEVLSLPRSWPSISAIGPLRMLCSSLMA